MSAAKRQIEASDLLDNQTYAPLRREKRRAIMALRQQRRVFVGPYAMLAFESFATLRQQVQEMLYIEGAPEGQLEEELEAYNPLVPQGKDLIATLLFEIDSATARTRILQELAGIEHKVFLTLGENKRIATPLLNAEQQQQAQRTSSVHFMCFALADEDITQFCNPAISVLLGFDHPAYRHQTALELACRQALAQDFAAL